MCMMTCAVGLATDRSRPTAFRFPNDPVHWLRVHRVQLRRWRGRRQLLSYLEPSRCPHVTMLLHNDLPLGLHYTNQSQN